MKFHTSMFSALAALPPVRARRLAPLPAARNGRARPELRWSRDIRGDRRLARWQLVPSAQDPGGMVRGELRLSA